MLYTIIYHILHIIYIYIYMSNKTNGKITERQSTQFTLPLLHTIPEELES